MVILLPAGLLAATTLGSCRSAESGGQHGHAGAASRWSGPAAWDVAGPPTIARRPAPGDAEAAPPPSEGRPARAGDAAEGDQRAARADTEEADDAEEADAADVGEGAADPDAGAEPEADDGDGDGGRADPGRPDGLVVEELAAGDGPAAAGDDLVRLRLEGRLPGGTIFDPDAGPRGPWPLDALTDGLAAGIRGMRVGGRRRLEIPPALGYGDEPVLDASGNPVVPAGATLVYEVELLEIVAADGTDDAGKAGKASETGDTATEDAASPGSAGSEEDAP